MVAVLGIEPVKRTGSLAVGLAAQALPLSINVKLRKIVASKLILDWSPKQISGWLKTWNPDDESMQCPTKPFTEACSFKPVER